jgi:hypothetical protein
MGLMTGSLLSPRRPPLFVSCGLVCEGTRLKPVLAMVIVQCEVWGLYSIGRRSPE